MKLSVSRRHVAVVVGAIATTAAVFAPSAVAKQPEPVLSFSCGGFGVEGSGTVNVVANGLAKGHCVFPGAFPDLTGTLVQPLTQAVNVPCGEVAQVLGFSPDATGFITLTPSGHAN